MLFTILDRIKATLEYLGGVREEPPAPSWHWMEGPLWWGFWWALLTLITLSFSGQTSKFIYIDF